jgi:hypothetical protein
MQIGKHAIVAVAALALALPCLAQNGGAPGGGGAPGAGAAGGGMNMVSMKVDKFFAEVNKSGTGKITKEEWKAAGLQDFVFSFIDSKNQGYIDKAMLAAAKLPAAMDTDGTGELTVAKMVAYDKKNGNAAPGGGGGGAPGGGGVPGGGGAGQGGPGGGGPPQQ